MTSHSLVDTIWLHPHPPKMVSCYFYVDIYIQIKIKLDPQTVYAPLRLWIHFFRSPSSINCGKTQLFVIFWNTAKVHKCYFCFNCKILSTICCIFLVLCHLFNLDNERLPLATCTTKSKFSAQQNLWRTEGCSVCRRMFDLHTCILAQLLASVMPIQL